MLSSLYTQQAVSVSDLNGFIKQMMDTSEALQFVTVRGEISNFKFHSSGHLYFSLKDEHSLIRAVMFRSYTGGLSFMPQNGMKVVVRGSVSVYPRDGQYQIYVNFMSPDGIGALYMAYEKLKRQLEAEGLFDPDRKKPIPRFPSSIGIITSATGAAICDLTNVLSRRYPLATVYLRPAEVQGRAAPASLLRALRFFEDEHPVDVIIIGRGGGSIEDLWAFNDETLARAIAAAHTPIISAVGHESDYTICDFVADLRAPTPSAAAELAVPHIRELEQVLSGVSNRLRVSVEAGLRAARKEYSRIADSPYFSRPELLVADRYRTLDSIGGELSSALEKLILQKRSALGTSAAQLEAISPLRLLSKGYAIVQQGETGDRISSASHLKEGDSVRLTFSDGTASAIIKESSL